MHLKMSSAMWWPFCSGFNEFISSYPSVWENEKFYTEISDPSIDHVTLAAIARASILVPYFFLVN